MLRSIALLALLVSLSNADAQTTFNLSFPTAVDSTHDAATSWAVQRKTGAGSFATLATTTTASYVDTITDSGGITYTYQVIASNAGGSSAPSNQVSVTTPSVAPTPPPPPPPSGSATVSLAFDGSWQRDRVGSKTLTADGSSDAIWTVTLLGGSRTVARVRFTSTLGGVWDTAGGGLPLGVASSYDAAFYNSSLSAVNFALANGGTFKMFMADPSGHTSASGVRFTVTVTFSDGTSAAATY